MRKPIKVDPSPKETLDQANMEPRDDEEASLKNNPIARALQRSVKERLSLSEAVNINALQPVIEAPNLNDSYLKSMTIRESSREYDEGDSLIKNNGDSPSRRSESNSFFMRQAT